MSLLISRRCGRADATPDSWTRPSPGLARTSALPLRQPLRSERTSVTGDTPPPPTLTGRGPSVSLRSRLACGVDPVANRRAHRRPDGERASVRDVLRAVTVLSRESVVLRLQERYMTRVVIVKKSTGSCSLGWACDPIRSGSAARRLSGKPPRLAAITPPPCHGFTQSATCRSRTPDLSQP